MMGPFKYFPLAFDKDGAIVDESQFAAAMAALSSTAVTDLIVISHGWNNDMPEAEALYTSIFTQVGAVLPLKNPACDAVRAKNVVVVGILWPSKKFDDSSLIPGGAAARETTRRTPCRPSIDCPRFSTPPTRRKRSSGPSPSFRNSAIRWTRATSSPD